MASKAASKLPLRKAQLTTVFHTATRRNLTSFLPPSRPNTLSSRIAQSAQQSFRQSTRRTYADSAPVKRKRAGFLRWTWRLTYLSALAGLGWVAYEVYLLRTPDEQISQDPKKKTLVILGITPISQFLRKAKKLQELDGAPCLS